MRFFKSKFGWFMVISLMVLFFSYSDINNEEGVTIKKTGEISSIETDIWKDLISGSINERKLNITCNGKTMTTSFGPAVMESDFSISIPYKAAIEVFDCSINLYKKKKLVIQRGDTKITARVGKDFIKVGKEKIDVDYSIYYKDMENGKKELYVPMCIFEKGLGVTTIYSESTNTTNVSIGGDILPSKYCYKDCGRIGTVARDQSDLGTCWAFAAIGALETTLMPEENYRLSVDHMSLQNAYGTNQSDGGQYTISWSYLASWLGPVKEEDDPYGDGISDDSLKAIKHVQEMQIIEKGDLEEIKKTVFKYGGVQSSIYIDSTDSYQRNMFYNEETYSYCYTGKKDPNHEVLIIGWDDNYSKDNFTTEVEGDGAFVCRNSWGTEFGDEGDFYVSYYDVCIGEYNEAYTRVDDNDNYDNIYEYDECGFCGTIGYAQTDSVYAANIFTANNDEEVKAIGFYAPQKNTDYRCYICTEFKGSESLSNNLIEVANGHVTNAGYYTVDFDGVEVTKGKEYAIVIKLSSEEKEKYIAIECVNSVKKDDSIINGKGFYSPNGITWDSSSKNNCDICLKAFTDDVS